MKFNNKQAEAIWNVIAANLEQWDKDRKGQIVRSLILNVTALFPEDTLTINTLVAQYQKEKQIASKKTYGTPATKIIPTSSTPLQQQQEGCDGCTGEKIQTTTKGKYTGMKPLTKETEPAKKEFKLTELKDVKQIMDMVLNHKIEGQTETSLPPKGVIKMWFEVLMPNVEFDNRWKLETIAEKIAEFNNQEKKPFQLLTAE